MRQYSILLIFALAACAVVGKDAFLREAPNRAGIFEGNYQALYKCFVEKNPTGDGAAALLGGFGPRAEIFSDLRMAEWRLSRHDAWFKLIEFRAVNDTRTDVRAWATERSELATHWREIEVCAAKR